MPRHLFAQRARQRAVQAWSLAVGLCLLLMLGMIAVGAGSGEAADTTDLQGRLNAANRQAEQLVHQISNSRQRNDALRRELASADQVNDQPDLKLLFEMVGRQLGNEAMLTSIRLGSADEPSIRSAIGSATGPARRWLVITGVAQDHQAVPEIVLRLEALGLFEKVVLHETFPESYRGSARVGFRVACRLPVAGQEGGGR